MITRVCTQAIQEPVLAPQTVNIANKHRSLSWRVVEVTGSRRDSKVVCSITQYLADYLCVCLVPAIVADSPPVSIETDLYSALINSIPSHKANISICAKCTGILSWKGKIITITITTKNKRKKENIFKKRNNQ